MSNQNDTEEIAEGLDNLRLIYLTAPKRCELCSEIKQASARMAVSRDPSDQDGICEPCVRLMSGAFGGLARKFNDGNGGGIGSG